MYYVLLDLQELIFINKYLETFSKNFLKKKIRYFPKKNKIVFFLHMLKIQETKLIFVFFYLKIFLLYLLKAVKISGGFLKNNFFFNWQVNIEAIFLQKNLKNKLQLPIHFVKYLPSEFLRIKTEKIFNEFWKYIWFKIISKDIFFEIFIKKFL